MTPIERKSQNLALLLLSAAAVVASFLWQGRAGFNIGDEGYLWYGVQRVMKGEVPIRDFLSYEPGRYYWSAILMRLWGDDGIVSLRVAVALFQVAGLFAAMALVFRSAGAPSRISWLLVAATFMAWMFPRHKLFDATLSILLVGTLTFLLRQPTLRRYLLAGVAVGLVAVFGRNHGMYGAAASIGAIALLCVGRASGPGPVQAFAVWAAGVTVGFIPILFLLAFAPGFAAAFWESIRFLLEAGTTNLPLPIPWPWRVSFEAGFTLEAFRQLLVGVFFVAIVVFGAAGIAASLVMSIRRAPPPPLFTASALMSIPYAHFAYSRADVGHLAQGVFPFLIGAFALLLKLPARAMWPLACALCAASLFIMLSFHPGWRCRVADECVSTEVGSSRLAVERPIAGDLVMLRDLVERFSPAGRPIYVAPFWPGAYAAFDRKSPVWEIYPLFPRNESMQRAEIQRLRNAEPGIAVIVDHALDSRDELRFRNTHPIIDRYIRDNFERLDGVTANPMYRVYRNPRAAK